MKFLLSISLVMFSSQALANNAAREVADKLLKARDAHNFTQVGQILSVGKDQPDQWTGPDAKAEMDRRLESLGRVVSSTFLYEKKQIAATMFVYATVFQKGGLHEEQVIVRMEGKKAIVDGPLSLKCSMMKCDPKVLASQKK